jgi:membrane protease YdiL (CAAX protease family)
MYNSDAKGISYTAGFFILIGFTLAAILMAALISIPIWTIMTGQSALSLEENMTNPQYRDAIMVITFVTAVVGFFLPAYFTALLLNRRPVKLLGFRGRISGIQAGLVIPIVIFSLFVSGSLAYFNEMIPLTDKLKTIFERWEKNYNDQLEALVSLNNFGEYLLAVLLLAVVPAITEEALFRGGFQNLLTRSTRAPWFSILFISLVFSLVHFSWYGFLSRLFLGIMLGLLFHLSGRLWLSILAHFLNNLAAVTFIYVYKLQGKSISEAINETDAAWWGILALPVVIYFFVLFRRYSEKNKEEPPPQQSVNADLFPRQYS